MAKNLEVQISFTGDSTALVEALDKLKKKLKEVEGANKKVTDANKKVSETSDKATKDIKENTTATDKNSKSKKNNAREGNVATKSNRLLKRSFATLRSEILLASFAFGTIGTLVGKFIALSNQQEDAEKRLETALGFRSQKLLEGASALQEQTRFGDEQIIQAQALIAAFVDEEDAILKATEATLDLASAKNMDLNAAADLVSKSIGSSTNALTRYGIQVSGAVGSTERLESAVNGIAKAFGETATQDALTFGGQVDQLQMRIGDFGEDIGDVQKTKFMPLLQTLNEATKGLINNDKAAKIAAGGLLVLAAGFTAMVSGGLIRVLIGSIAALVTNIRTLGTVALTAGKTVGRFFGRIFGKKGANQVDDVAKKVVPFGEKLTNLIQSFLQTASAGSIAYGTFKILGNNADEAAIKTEKLNKAQERLRIRNEVAASALKATAEEQLKANILLASGTATETANNKALFKTMQEIERITGQDIVLNEEKISQLGLHASMVEGLTDKEKELFNTRLALNEQTIAGSISDEKATQLRTAALAQFGQTLAGLRPGNKSIALLSVRLSQIQAVADAYAAFNKFQAQGRLGLASIALAQGLANAATIEKQAGKVRAAAMGADFVTQGRQMLMVGDNDTGAERVQVTPLGNNRAGSGGMRDIQINLNGNVLGTNEFVRDELIPAIEDTLERNLA